MVCNAGSGAASSRICHHRPGRERDATLHWIYTVFYWSVTLLCIVYQRDETHYYLCVSLLSLRSKFSIIVIVCLASSFIMPCLSAAISSVGPAHQKGSINGIFRSLGSLARGLGPLIASFGKLH